MEKTIAVYYRVSTADQHSENQMLAVSEWCISKKIAEIDVEVYEDRLSGADFSRPNLMRLVDDIKVGKIKRVIVWRLDRLGRSLQHLIGLMDLFKRHGVEFISLKESIDTSSSAGVLMFHVIGAMAQFERDLIRERAFMSIRRRKAEGLPVGRPKNSRDKRVRKKDGYKRRYLLKDLAEAKASYNLLPSKVNLNRLQKLSKQLGLNGDEVRNPNLPTKEEVKICLK